MAFFNEDGGPAGLFAQMAQNFGMGFGHQHGSIPSSYDEYFKAYSVAMLPGRERENLSYGGKIVMPPSALARLTQLDIDSPWMFKLRNPSNPAASTHCGVLEFIADEGCVHLPYWMMKTLRLSEGDPIRITGIELRKGKFVKLQAQQVHFLEISDPKAVLEQALRNFTALTQGDIIEISYNSIVFGLLVMEATPGGEGISVLDTDLEVDFAPPVGYVEPERPKAAPPPTMASKLNIDLNSSTPGSSRPTSSMGGNFAGTSKGATTVSKDGDRWEIFKGKGETLSGRKTKGRGINHRGIESVPEGSKILRTDKHKVVSNDDMNVERNVPAPLNLPFGKLFFGFNVVPYVPPEPKEENTSGPSAFSGSGSTLNGRSNGATVLKGKATQDDNGSAHDWGSGGQTLSAQPTLRRPFGNGVVGAGGASVPNLRRKQRSPSPEDDENDWGVDDDEVIDVDSD
ncbi:UFD1-domain-containing protein [Vararia minispora EC-137]|uniref:UFD1-domain-containing protein n=1 Tax=Vararia minispora EC-137 TaxID=1314806 RepID=A0ACB8QKC8_9AGAM|nr:UFD1-domain-containing protein [Vararia minispora EC-137]